MLQRWERLKYSGEANFNRQIDPPTRSSVSHLHSAVDSFREGLCCEHDVELIAHSTVVLFDHCQKCLPASWQSSILGPGHLVGSQHNADRYWDRYGLDETPKLRSVRLERMRNEELDVEDEDEDDEMFEASASSVSSSNWSEYVDTEDGTSEAHFLHIRPM